MNIETVAFDKWENSVRLTNEHLELIVTTDIGPRVVSLRNHDRENVFKIFEDQLGGKGENEWMVRGGHRFWVAPEDIVLSYHIDNEPVPVRQEESGEVLIESVQSERKIRKTLGITLAANAPRVTVKHTLTNEGEEPFYGAPWALSVMEAGGLEIIPQPPLGEHPRDLLPNRGMVLWPYTDLSDGRMTFGQKFWLLRQAEGYLPFKLGLAHREKWVAYVLGDTIFFKFFAHEDGATYPDGGCNFETFTNSEMLEVESLAPLVTLAPGESTTLVEDWYVFPLTEELQIESEETLEAWLNGFIAQTHLA